MSIVPSTAARRGLGRISLISLLILLTFTSTLMRVADGAMVTAVACTDLTSSSQGSCASGTTVTFTGDALTGVTGVLIGSTTVERKAMTCTALSAIAATSFTCTLALSETAFAGIYPVTLVTSTAGDVVAAGSLAVGSLPAFSATAYGFTSGWRNVQPSASEVVSGFSTSMIVSGAAWQVYGNFDAAKTYKVLFYSDTELGMIACNNGAAITPSSVDAQAASGFVNALVCTVTSEPGVMGMFTLLVQDATTGAFVPGTTGLYMISVTPPLPVITDVSGNCAATSTACVAGAELTFTGTNFNTHKPEYNTITILKTDAFAAVTGASSTKSGLTCTATAVTSTTLTCTLAVDAATVKDGSYAIYAQVDVCTHKMLSDATYVGNFMYGTAYGAASVAGVTLGTTDMTSGGQVVKGKTDGYIYTGGWLAVFGDFDATHKFTFQFYNTQAAGNGVPTCTAYDVTSYMINCTGVTQTLGNLGMYRVLIKDTTGGYYVPTVTTELAPIMVFAPLPTFATASGDCATDSAKCMTGSTLTFTGSNFVADKKIAITFDQPGITCSSASARSATSAICVLTIDDSVPAGQYAMYVSVQGCAMGMMTPPNAAGQLILTKGVAAGEGSSPGWKASSPDANTSGTTTSKGKSKTNTAAVVCAVIFGILTVAFGVGFVIAICLFCRVRKTQAGNPSRESYAAAAELVGVAPRGDPFAEEKVV